MFDVITFLEDNHIPYRTEGPNCAKGGIVVKCPFCGDEDPSEHLGIQLSTAYWNCLRHGGHGGRRPHRLIMKLLGCGYTVADDIVVGARDLGGLAEVVDRLRSPKPESEEHVGNGLELPRDYRPLTSKGLGCYYQDYLVRRRFRREDLDAVCAEYSLGYCKTGFWHGRIIFPVWFEGRLVTWTGRAISRNARLRYLTLSPNAETEDSPLALRSIRNVLWNYDALVEEKFHTLCVVEGPLDALKVDVYGSDLDVRATCLFGAGISEEQIALLSELRGCCSQIVFLGDDDGLSNVMQVWGELSFLQLKVGSLPDRVEDPGAMSPRQVRRFALSCVEGEV